MAQWREKYGIHRATAGPIALVIDWKSDAYVAAIYGNSGCVSCRDNFSDVAQAKAAAIAEARRQLEQGLKELGELEQSK